MEKLYLIRGERIIQQLLEDMTVPDLERSTLQFVPPVRPNRRQHAVNTVQIQKMNFAPDRQMNTLTIQAIAQTPGGKYTPMILFGDVLFDDSNQANNTTFRAINGQEFHIDPITLNNHNAKVRCNCLDFYYRAAHADNAKKALFGAPPPPYVKVTDRPYSANVKFMPLLCKHLLRLVQELRSLSIVQG